MTDARIAFEAAALRARVEVLQEQLQAAREERDVLEQERDQALYEVSRLSHRLAIAHGEGGK